MATIIEQVNPTKVENTTMTMRTFDTGAQVYTIQANDGYLLHDRELDIVDTDIFTEEELSRLPGFTSAMCSCSARYDWEANPREFYAIFESEIPANQIFGGNYNDHGA